MKKLFMIMVTLMCVSWAAVAQNRTIHGQVVDAGTNEPLIGATVMPVGGGQGAATDVDGNFSISVPAKVSKAKVSYVGYNTETVNLTNGMVVKLTSTSSDLDEVMVVAYGTAKKSAYTGSASVVKAGELQDALVSNAADALAGKISGVQIQSNNGQPGSAPTILIRGIGSINANNSPLYVLDGVPYDGDLSNINTMDIESMTVLKDAAAAALYGARGANGVIMVTTKKGSQGSAKVSIDARWGANHRAVPRYDVLGSTQEFVETAYKSLRNGYYYNMTGTSETAHQMANANIFSRLGYQVYTLPDGEGLIGTDGRLNPNAKLGYAQGDYYYTPDDWSKEQLRDGFRQEYNLSVTGGNEKLSYFVSGAFLDDQGLIKDSHFRRFSTRASADYQIKKWLKIGTNISYAYVNSGYPDMQTDAGSSGNAFLMADQIAPYYPMYVRNADGTVRRDAHTGLPVYDYGTTESTDFVRNWMSNSNPAGDLAYNTEEYLMDIFNGKWYLQLNPVEGLTITGTMGYYIDHTRYHSLGNPFYGQSKPYGGSAVQMSERVNSINLQALANYQKTFNEKHDLDLLVGYETYDWKDEMLEGVGYDLYLPDSWVMNNTSVSDKKLPYGSVDRYATRGVFGRVNYSFDSRYFFSASVRGDASSRFAPGKRWGTFWSLSGAWSIGNEKFMAAAAHWLDQLKFKVSFGQQGNDNLNRGNYPWQDQYRLAGNDGVWSDGVLYRKGNPDITWETSNNFNIGFDFSFVKGMVSGTIEYFNRQTSNMLYNKPVAPSLGYSSIPMNIGSMRNNGLEIELNVRPIQTKNVTWNIFGNITTVGNKVLKLHPDLHGQLIQGSRIFREGEAMYQSYMVKYAGVDPVSGKALYWDADPILDENGNIQKDAQGNIIVGEEFASTNYTHAYNYNRRSTGNLLPKAYGGFGTSVDFFGFDFSMQFAFQFGGKIYDNSYASLMHNGNTQDMGKNWHKDIYKAWTPENPYSDIPRLSSEDEFTSSYSTRFLVSSNYLSLQNLTLGYTLPKNVVKKLRLTNVRVYFAGENLFLASARKGLDPRQGFVESEGATYKGSRSLSGGIRIEF